jgi:hypothetical protein
MAEVKNALRYYTVVLNDDLAAKVRGADDIREFEASIKAGKVKVRREYGPVLAVSPLNLKSVLPSGYATHICAHCEEPLELHPGETFCKKCENRTFLPVVEY